MWTRSCPSEPWCETSTLRMSSVAAIAKTPSANVSRRAVGMALRFEPGCPILAEHTEGRIPDAEVDLGDDDTPAAAPVQPERALVVLLRREDRRAGLRREQRVVEPAADA